MLKRILLTIMFLFAFTQDVRAQVPHGVTALIYDIQRMEVDTLIVVYAQIDSLNAVTVATDSNFSRIIFNFASPRPLSYRYNNHMHRGWDEVKN